MPGYDASLPISPSLEPPQLDADETLPTQIHPSYPFGRPPTYSRPAAVRRVALPNLMGTVEGVKWGRGEGWEEVGMEGVVERERGREVPPGMAVSSILGSEGDTVGVYGVNRTMKGGKEASSPGHGENRLACPWRRSPLLFSILEGQDARWKRRPVADQDEDRRRHRLAEFLSSLTLCLPISSRPPETLPLVIPLPSPSFPHIPSSSR